MNVKVTDIKESPKRRTPPTSSTTKFNDSRKMSHQSSGAAKEMAPHNPHKRRNTQQGSGFTGSSNANIFKLNHNTDMDTDQHTHTEANSVVQHIPVSQKENLYNEHDMGAIKAINEITTGKILRNLNIKNIVEIS